MRDFQLPGRSAALAEHGMAATSHPVATLTALDVLRAGGNAVDAAIAAAAVLAVVEPQMTGIGGDVFALIGKADGEILAFNGSGRAPAALTLDRLEADGTASLERSPHGVTVPGAVDAWAQLLAASGTRGLDDLLRPAIRLAEEGFLVTPRAAFDWAHEGEQLQASESARAIYLPGGRTPIAGDRLALPALAATLRRIAECGPRAFYEGELAAAMVAFLQSRGGLHTLDDFGNAQGEFVNPIQSSYRGIEVVECPPNGHGVSALQTLNILEGFALAGLDPHGAKRLHLEVEAGRLALHDRDSCLGDPAQVEVPVERLLSKAYAARLRAHIDPARAADRLPTPLLPEHPDTTYLTVVDRDRTIVSLINSIFDTFGSGLACPTTGVLFHNRGHSFSLERGHPNALAPGKRPLHTIIPALALADGQPTIGFGVMGGHYQPVGQAHVLLNLVDFEMDPQAAIDSPRAFTRGAVLELERGVPEATAVTLARMGHRSVRPEKPLGGGQMIMLDRARGVLIGASDPRKDGVALGY